MYSDKKNTKTLSIQQHVLDNLIFLKFFRYIIFPRKSIDC